MLPLIALVVQTDAIDLQEIKKASEEMQARRASRGGAVDIVPVPKPTDVVPEAVASARARAARAKTREGEVDMKEIKRAPDEMRAVDIVPVPKPAARAKTREEAVEFHIDDQDPQYEDDFRFGELEVVENQAIRDYLDVDQLESIRESMQEARDKLEEVIAEDDDPQSSIVLLGMATRLDADTRFLSGIINQLLRERGGRRSVARRPQQVANEDVLVRSSRLRAAADALNGALRRATEKNLLSWNNVVPVLQLFVYLLYLYFNVPRTEQPTQPYSPKYPSFELLGFSARAPSTNVKLVERRFHISAAKLL